MLIFMIFVMLAAERKTEMGMARAVGAQRNNLVQMFVSEGMAYNLMAGAVDLTDFTFLASNFNYTLPSGASVGAVVPEPAALSLLLVATAIGVQRRPRRSR